MNKPQTKVGSVSLDNVQTIGFQPQHLVIRSKCVLCDSDIEKELPNGVLPNGFMPPYVCDKRKAVWKKLSEGI